MKYFTKIKSTILFIISLCALSGNAQQDPLYTQYMFNTLAINPAYAGSKDMLNVMALSRHQWVGFDGAPSTQTFTMHTPIRNKDFGIGASIINDKIGPQQQFGLYVDYSYQLQFSRSTKLYLGLKAGFNNLKVDLRSLNTSGLAYDPSYDDNISSKFMPNFGVGMYLSMSNKYFGISIPKLLENKIETDGNSTTISREKQHYFIIGGMVTPIADEILLRPGFLVRLVQGAPPSADLNLNMIIRERFWIGGLFRIGDSFGIITQYQLNEQLRFGYAFDLTTSEFRTNHAGTHEVMLSFDFEFIKDRIRTPRYFY